MAKHKSAPYMSPGEQIAGTVFFVIYLVVLPFATAPLFRLAERLLGTAISPSLQNAIYYYILFAVTLVIFHSFLGRTTRTAGILLRTRRSICLNRWILQH